MTVEQLIKQYNKNVRVKKDYDFSQHLKTSYLPYARKMALAQRVINATSYISVEDVEVYRQNTPSMLLFFAIGLLEEYTNIEFVEADKSKEYDALAEAGILNKLLAIIPESEHEICKGILDMTRNDLLVNTRSIVSFLETQAKSMTYAIQTLNQTMENNQV